MLYCNKLYKSFCFLWWNRNEKQKYNTDINICTNKSGPFIREQNMKLVVVHAIIHSFGSKKLAPCKIFSWLLSWLLTFKTGTWKWHLVIFLAPTFWEPEQPLEHPCKLETLLENRPPTFCYGTQSTVKLEEPTFLHQIKWCFGILFGLSVQVNMAFIFDINTNLNYKEMS